MKTKQTNLFSFNPLKSSRSSYQRTKSKPSSHRKTHRATRSHRTVHNHQRTTGKRPRVLNKALHHKTVAKKHTREAKHSRRQNHTKRMKSTKRSRRIRHANHTSHRTKTTSRKHSSTKRKHQSRTRTARKHRARAKTDSRAKANSSFKPSSVSAPKAKFAVSSRSGSSIKHANRKAPSQISAESSNASNADSNAKTDHDRKEHRIGFHVKYPISIHKYEYLLTKYRISQHSVTPDDRAFLRLAKAKYDTKYDIHSYSYCQSILLDASTNSTLHSEAYARLAHRLKPRHYYHVKSVQKFRHTNEALLKLYPLDTYLMTKIYDSVTPKN